MITSRLLSEVEANGEAINNLLLAQVTKTVLQNGLEIFGVNEPERMRSKMTFEDHKTTEL